MVHTFDTPSSAPTTQTGEGGSNTLIWVLAIGVVAYLGYTYIIKPELEKEKEKRA